MTSHFYSANLDSGKNIINRAFKKYKLENLSLGIIEFWK